MSTLIAAVTDLLVFAATGTAVMLALVGLAFVVSKRRVRVSRGHATGAPARWLLTPTRTALLHRRLRRAIRGLREVVPAPKRRREPSPVQNLAADLELLAVSIDRELVAVRWQPMRMRHRSLNASTEGVRGVERLAARLVSVAQDLDPAGSGSVAAQARLDQLADAIQAFEQALEELAPFDLASPYPAGTRSTPSDRSVADSARFDAALRDTRHFDPAASLDLRVQAV